VQGTPGSNHCSIGNTSASHILQHTNWQLTSGQDFMGTVILHTIPAMFSKIFKQDQQHNTNLKHALQENIFCFVS
jgi:hypothetical protein